jgi:U3 small nucleolar ribonucleoprotein protein IMP4
MFGEWNDPCLISHTVQLHISRFIVVLRHDIPDRGTVSVQYPHLIFNEFNSWRKSDEYFEILSCSKEDAEAESCLSNDNDFISIYHHVFYRFKDK